jgi:hypothetical protein
MWNDVVDGIRRVDEVSGFICTCEGRRPEESRVVIDGYAPSREIFIENAWGTS